MVPSGRRSKRGEAGEVAIVAGRRPRWFAAGLVGHVTGLAGRDARRRASRGRAPFRSPGPGPQREPGPVTEAIRSPAEAIAIASFI
jgi:hypothetical protein